MSTSPLGSLRSWVLDGALAGLSVPPTVLAVLLLLAWWLQGSAGGEAWEVVIVSSVVGLGIGLVTSPALWRAASLAWPWPLLSLSLGPALGSLSAWTTLTLLSWAMDGRSPSLSREEWLILLGLGAFAIGPPWVAYVAVRSRGRPGTPVVLATLCWVAGATALVVGVTWVRRRGWIL
jgi:hypothetical protein